MDWNIILKRPINDCNEMEPNINWQKVGDDIKWSLSFKNLSETDQVLNIIDAAQIAKIQEIFDRLKINHSKPIGKETLSRNLCPKENLKDSIVMYTVDDL